MLEELCNGTQESKCILIKDSADQNGRPVFVAFITGALQRVDRVVIFCWEKSPIYYTALVTPKLAERVHLIDCTKDPANWLNIGCPTVDSNLADLLRDHVRESDKKFAVAFDGLTFLLLHRHTPYTFGCVVERVISLVHTDLHPDLDIRMLEHVSSSVVHVRSSPGQQYDVTCSIVHRRISGKVIKSTELVKLDGVNILSTKKWQQDSLKIVPEESEQVDPAANLTFNLTLSDKEKEARKQLVLPYMKEQRRDPHQPSSVSSKIYYEPDKEDDFDEEDPDDDLDI